MRSIGIASLAALCWLGFAPQAQAGEWVQLGERMVNFGAERDSIPVTANKGLFNRIKLKVFKNSVQVIDVKVTFGNGETHDVKVRQWIEKGGETRVIDLPGAARVIRRVDLVYKTRGRRLRGRAGIRLFGKQVAGGATPPAKPAVEKPIAKPKPVVWVPLGERKVNFVADRDTILVTGVAGVFKKIKLKVLDKGIQMVDLKVHFGNGEVHDVQVRKWIAAGGETRVIDLPGEARVIKKVTMIYRTKGLKIGRATVKLFGKKIVGTGAAPPPAAKPKPKPNINVGKWQFLGERQVKHRAERDTIVVTASEGTFRRLQFKVKRRRVQIKDIKVHFGNGQVQDVSVRAWIPSGGESRVIDLPGAARVIKKVTFVYETAGPPLGPKAHIRLWGKH